MLLYAKKLRMRKREVPGDLLRLFRHDLWAVLKCQRAIRRFLGRLILQRRRRVQMAELQLVWAYGARKCAGRLAREKETYWLQRHSLGHVENDHIDRYVRKQESNFDKDWGQYENKLEKFLTGKKQGELKDWIERKDDTGRTYWTHTKTLASQAEHPGVKMFNVNKKMLKNKARQELDRSLHDVEDRRFIIQEAMIVLKGKISKEVSQMRLKSAMSSRRERGDM